MAESMPSLGQSSDDLTDTYCEPCYEASYKVKPCAGHCQNCDKNLCKECFSSHRGFKQFRSHRLVKKLPRLKLQPTLGTWLKNGFKNKVREYMPTVALIIVAIILTSILNFHNEEISKLAKNIEDSKDLRNLKDVVNDVQKFRDEFVDLMNKTEKQADLVKSDDFTKTDKILVEQINKLTEQLEILKEKDENEKFTATKNAQDQLQSLEEKLDKLDKDNIVRENKKLKAILKAKRPTHIKDIIVKSFPETNFGIFNSLVVSNKEILILDYTNRKLMLIDTNKDQIISQLQLSGNPLGVTEVGAREVAVSVFNPNTIQFISVSQNVMSKVREFKCNGHCDGIIYNERDKTLIVTTFEPPKVKILDMSGTEIKCLEHDSKGEKLFKPFVVALSPDMTNIYVTDYDNNSVTLMSLNGEIKAVYNTGRLGGPIDVYVHKSGLVYVVGLKSRTIHELDPESGEFKVVLDVKDGLKLPISISYCEMEDKMYIGMFDSNVLKVFQMK